MAKHVRSRSTTAPAHIGKVCLDPNTLVGKACMAPNTLVGCMDPNTVVGKMRMGPNTLVGKVCMDPNTVVGKTRMGPKTVKADHINLSIVPAHMAEGLVVPARPWSKGESSLPQRQQAP